MPTQPLYIMSALQGTYTLNDGSTWTGECDGVYVTESAVFNTLNDNNGNDRADYISSPTTAVKAGTLIRPILDGKFTSIDLASGQVTLIL